METLPHGYINATTGDGSVVTKRYLGPGAASRCAREGGSARWLPRPARSSSSASDGGRAERARPDGDGTWP